MTFVIIGGGIDLSVGALVALASVWATTVATQDYGAGRHDLCALLVGVGAGLVNGVLIAYGRLVPFIVTLAMLVSARGLAAQDGRQPHPDRRRQQTIVDIARTDVIGVPMLVLIFAAVVAGRLAACSTARPSAGAPSPSAATPRRRGSPASTYAGTPRALRAVRAVLRHRRAHADGAHDHRLEHARQPLRARRHRRGHHRRHAAQRRHGHARRLDPRRARLHDDHQHLHPQQPGDRGPEHRQGR